MIQRAEMHQERWITIQRAQVDAFYNAYREASFGASIRDPNATIFS